MLRKIKLYKLVLLAVAAFILLDAVIAIGLRVGIFVAPVALLYWGYVKYKKKQAAKEIDPEGAAEYSKSIDDILNSK